MNKSQIYAQGRAYVISLMEAVSKGDLESLSKKYDSSEDINEISEGNGRLLVHLSALNGHSHILEFLTSVGADHTLLDNDSNNIATLATYHERLDFLRFVQSKYPESLAHKNSKGMTMLHISAETGNKELVEFALSLNLDINQESEHGTPLELAVMWKKPSIINHLLESGADPNGTYGKFLPPPIVMATSMQFLEGFSALIEHGADVELAGPDGASALEVAAEFEFISFITLLRARGASITGRAIKAAYQQKKQDALDFLIPYDEPDVADTGDEPSEEDKERANSLKAEGNQMFAQKEYARAVEFYTQAIEIWPLSIFYSNRSNAYFHLAEYENTLNDAELSLRIDSKNLKGYIRKANALEAMQENLKAAAAYWAYLKVQRHPEIHSQFLKLLGKF